MRHSLVPLLTAAAIAFGVCAGPTAANAESVMAACASQWKQAQAAGTTGGETWPQFLAQCRTRGSAAAAPSQGSFAPAPAPAPAPSASQSVRLPVPVVAAVDFAFRVDVECRRSVGPPGRRIYD